MSEEDRPEGGVSPGRIIMEIGELSSKQRNAVLGLVKDTGFTPEEIREVVVLLPRHDDEGATGKTAL
ncbi:MAG: hypothetical protein KKE79_00945 [Actinobacteria bacterium]|nr:hypothetical protein [Actinomycetota bacterium]MCG2796552.1 hypothetical protein [Actinomycetes bacterium]MBU4240149.1 hypothetical protein [Actinomycetota bacterium]MBU4302705.1 hypothetical protein [Actinomycetota bacterium]MBU4386633.1 hypothetical protein [Actinomycetota bacterium]